ncbi:MAG: Sec-independent protein translocase protein TatB [Rhodoplanes sp.]|jgi:sec-independent protein translocase protein TatB
MFDIGWSELVLIGVVALIVIGPKELPGVLRAIGQWSAKIRRMAAEFQGQFHEAMREAELADLKKQVDEINDSARSIGRFDPLTYDPDKQKSSSDPGKEKNSSAAAANGAEASPDLALPGATEPPAPTAASTEATEAPASPAASSAPSELGTGNRSA